MLSLYHEQRNSSSFDVSVSHKLEKCRMIAIQKVKIAICHIMNSFLYKICGKFQKLILFFKTKFDI